jgi:RNA polymerase sigma factor (sigma-70 family)
MQTVTKNRHGWVECDPEVVENARRGDVAALNGLLVSIQDPVYSLALRMLADPEGARDATQEVLLRVAKGLPKFRAESALSTWVYRVALNVLFASARSAAERRATSFDAVAGQLDEALAAAEFQKPVADPVLVEETRLFCTHGMLLCLDRGQRAAYILCEIFEVSSSTVADALGITGQTLRKRLSRARAAMNEFMRARCGLVNEAARCRCAKLTAVAVAQKLISADRLRYALHPTAAESAIKRQMKAYASAIELFRDHPRYASPELMKTLRLIEAEGSSKDRDAQQRAAPDAAASRRSPRRARRR